MSGASLDTKFRDALRATLRTRSDVRVPAMRRAAERLRPLMWKQWDASTGVNGWTVLFELMAEEEPNGRYEGHAEVVHAVLDAGIAATTALQSFVAQTIPAAFTSANVHHDRLFRLLLERTEEHTQSSLLLGQSAARCRDLRWCNAIQQARNRSSPQLQAQIAAAAAAADAANESRKRKELADNTEEDETDSDDCNDSVAHDESDDSDSVQPPAPKKRRIKPSNRSPTVASPPTTELMQQLQSLIGMEPVVQQVKDVIRDHEVRLARARDPRPLPNAPSTLHLIFSGAPGTCKTTVARLIAKIYQSLGILSKGTITEVKQADLQGTVVGESEKKTKKILESCIGGVLFIDEVYTLADKSSYGSVIVNTMLTYLEEYRSDLVVIIAGYQQGVDAFLSMNEGLSRRFPTTITFEDYTPAALVQIFKHICAVYKQYLTAEAEGKLLSIVQEDYARRDHIVGYGNGGDMRTMYEAAITSINRRLPYPLPSPLTDEVREMMSAILEGDIQRLPRRLKESTHAADESLAPLAAPPSTTSAPPSPALPKGIGATLPIPVDPTPK